jgi:hypothetical protein
MMVTIAKVIFLQWMEILPTDQVAPRAVEYDPKTLQVKDPCQPDWGCNHGRPAR